MNNMNDINNKDKIREIAFLYTKSRERIKSRLEEFKKTPETEYFNELVFCILTPQSNAKKCWSAVEEIQNIHSFSRKNLLQILKSKTRFHNNKASYLIQARNSWGAIKPSLEQANQNLSQASPKKLRDCLAESINGLGMKEASHFLRNIGKSGNQIAILDRHILKNLKELGIIQNVMIKNKKDYLEKEARFLEFAEKVNIPIDELDLLFWSKENGDIFK